MKWIKKLMKWLLISLLLLVAGCSVAYLAFDKPLPKGEEGERAQQLVSKMEEAINLTAWDSTRYVEWTFAGTHHYVWDKERHLVEVTWGKNRVLLNPTTMEGMAYKNGNRVEDQDKIEQASKFFTNDAFWLNAPAQMAGNRDVKLQVVTLEDEQEALLITYLNGGDTPGDSYLWKLDENGLPVAWQMWVSIIPMNGLEFQWTDWVTLPTGALISTRKKGLLPISITNLKSYQVAEEDIFAKLEER